MLFARDVGKIVGGDYFTSAPFGGKKMIKTLLTLVFPSWRLYDQVGQVAELQVYLQGRWQKFEPSNQGLRVLPMGWRWLWDPHHLVLHQWRERLNALAFDRNTSAFAHRKETSFGGVRPLLHFCKQERPELEEKFRWRLAVRPLGQQQLVEVVLSGEGVP